MAVQLDYTSVLGYYSPADIEKVGDEDFEYFLIFHNIMNVAAALVSPIAGLIRAIVAAVRLHFYSEQNAENKDPSILHRKNFLVAEIVRGVAEVFGLGYLLAIGDVVVSLNRYQLLCFAPVKV